MNGNTSDRQERFSRAFHSAETISVYWCPILQRRFFDEKRWNAVCSQFARDQWTVPFTTESLKRAALEFCPNDKKQALTLDLDAIVAIPARFGWRPLEPGIHSFDDSPDRVASATHAVLSNNGKFYSASQFFFRTLGHVEFRCSVGFYETVETLSSKRAPWGVDLNVVATYDAAELRTMLPAATDLQAYFRHYCEAMFQESVYFVLNSSDSGQEAWLVRAGNGTVAYKGRPTIWHLKTTRPRNWLAQFDHMQQTMRNEKRRDDFKRHRVEMRYHRCRLGGDESVGATLEQAPDDANSLRVVITGRGRFLFETIFPACLHPKERASKPTNGLRSDSNDSYGAIESSSNELEELILLDTRKNGHVREVLYAPYEDDTEVDHRCFCGRNYPSEKPGACSVLSPEDVVFHRRTNHDWIREAIANHHGIDWDWLVLSSPHFYHSKHPNGLKKHSNKSRRKAAEDAAAKWARGDWSMLFRNGGILCD